MFVFAATLFTQICPESVWVIIGVLSTDVCDQILTLIPHVMRTIIFITTLKLQHRPEQCSRSGYMDMIFTQCVYIQYLDVRLVFCQRQ